MAHKFKGSSRQNLALKTFVKLMRSANRVAIDCNSVIVANHLTESQFGVLEALYHLGPLSQKQLAEKLLKSGGNLTMVVDNLARNGLVTRERRLDDRRFYWVKLTEKGEKLIAEVFPEHAELIAERMQVLSDEEQLRLQELCCKLGLAHQSAA